MFGAKKPPIPLWNDDCSDSYTTTELMLAAVLIACGLLLSKMGLIRTPTKETRDV